jgi:hypothetical protein
MSTNRPYMKQGLTPVTPFVDRTHYARWVTVFPIVGQQLSSSSSLFSERRSVEAIARQLPERADVTGKNRRLGAPLGQSVDSCVATLLEDLPRQRERLTASPTETNGRASGKFQSRIARIVANRLSVAASCV